jgi:hypothetical protein
MTKDAKGYELNEEQKQLLLANYRKLERNGNHEAGGMAGPAVDDEIFLDLLSKRKFTPPVRTHLDFTDDQKQKFIMRHLNYTHRDSASKSSKFNQNLSLKATKRHLQQLLHDLKTGELT